MTTFTGNKLPLEPETLLYQLAQKLAALIVESPLDTPAFSSAQHWLMGKVTVPESVEQALLHEYVSGLIPGRAFAEMDMRDYLGLHQGPLPDPAELHQLWKQKQSDGSK